MNLNDIFVAWTKGDTVLSRRKNAIIGGKNWKEVKPGTALDPDIYEYMIKIRYYVYRNRNDELFRSLEISTANTNPDKIYMFSSLEKEECEEYIRKNQRTWLNEGNPITAFKLWNGGKEDEEKQKAFLAGIKYAESMRNIN